MSNNVNDQKKINNTKPRRTITTALKLLAALCVLSIVPLANYNIDPSVLYTANRESAPELRAVDIMQKGENVAGLKANYNERLLRREYILRLESAPETLVLGSSRGALITTDMLGLARGKLFNASVAGGELEDAIGFYGLLDMHGLAPKKLLLSLDPWTVNDNFSVVRYQESVGDGYYHYAHNRMGLTVPESITQIKPLYDPASPKNGGFFSLSRETQLSLFSIPYFQKSIQYFFSEDYNLYKEISATSNIVGDTGIVHYDGSYSYPLDYQLADAATATERALRTIPNILGLEDYDVLRGRKYDELKSFLESVKEDGVDVQLVMFPICSYLYDYMGENANRAHYSNFFLSESMFRELAAELDVPIYGSFNPHSLGCDMNNFYDGYHLRDASVAEILSATIVVQ
ncbi:MAG: hypothetical protein RR998_06925 [Oscillospiraceae bacterium]